MKLKAREYVTESHGEAEGHARREDRTEDPLVGAEDHRDGAGGTVIESRVRL